MSSLPSDFRQLDRFGCGCWGERDHSGWRHHYNERFSSFHQRSGGQRFAVRSEHPHPRSIERPGKVPIKVIGQAFVTTEENVSGKVRPISQADERFVSWSVILRRSSLQVGILRNPVLIQQLDRGGWPEIWILPLPEGPNNFLSRSYFNDLNS
jgi:hypothetical protein